MGTKNIDKEPIDIIIPTYNNLQQLIAAVNSMYRTKMVFPMRFIIVNNGTIPLDLYFPVNNPEFILVNPGKNLGWTGGLKEGLKYSTSKHVVFANDDVFIPISSMRWLSQMYRHLIISRQVAAVGPTSNLVMGGQNIFAGYNNVCFMAPFLIGFCMMVRRSSLDEIGGIDEAFVTGDDLDLSIRFMKAGYYLMVDASIFVYHHGFQTGEKVYGKPSLQGGWNSQKMTDDTNRQLIRKHGFMEWWYTKRGYPDDYPRKEWDVREETEIVRKYVNGTDPQNIVDIGCGGSKVVKESIGVDILPAGTEVPYTGYHSDADIIADTEKELPFPDKRFQYVIARHVLEHCTDIVATLENWRRILADDGKLIICCPDERISDTIILNPEHVHAFTPDTLGKIVKKIGFRIEAVEEFYISDSFTLVLSKEAQVCA